MADEFGERMRAKKSAFFFSRWVGAQDWEMLLALRVLNMLELLSRGRTGGFLFWGMMWCRGDLGCNGRLSNLGVADSRMEADYVG